MNESFVKRQREMCALPPMLLNSKRFINVIQSIGSFRSKRRHFWTLETSLPFQHGCKVRAKYRDIHYLRIYQNVICLLLLHTISGYLARLVQHILHNTQLSMSALWTLLHRLHDIVFNQWELNTRVFCSIKEAQDHLNNIRLTMWSLNTEIKSRFTMLVAVVIHWGVRFSSFITQSQRKRKIRRLRLSSNFPYTEVVNDVQSGRMMSCRA